MIATRCLLALFLLGACAAESVAAPPAAERADLRRSRRQVRDDRRDQTRLAAVVQRWQRATQANDRRAERAADAQLKAWLVQELGEERRELTQAQREREASRRELHRSRVVAGPSPRTRDDRRDLADDRRDVRRQAAEAALTRSLAQQLRALQPRFDAGTARPADYANKRRLLDALLAAERREVRGSRREVREDRRERRE